MSKFCEALGRRVLYLDCLECDDRVCESPQIAILTKKEKVNHHVDNNTNIAAELCQEPKRATEEEVIAHPNCETCFHKCGEHKTTMFGRTFQAVQCQVFHNRVFTSRMISENGCDYHNRDITQEKICLNCEYYLGGGDWGLACKADYYKLPSSTTEACEKFERKQEK